MSFLATARFWFATKPEKTVPRQSCRCAFCLTGAVMGGEMKLEAEYETEVFRNEGGGATIKQNGLGCERCGEDDPEIVFLGTTERIRSVANALLSIADEIDSGE